TCAISEMLTRHLYPQFPAEDEHEFLIAHNTSSIPNMRIVLRVGALIFAGFSIFDFVADPINAQLSSAIRLGYGVTCIVASSLPKRILRSHLQALVVCCAILAAIALNAVAMVLPHVRDSGASLV